MLLGCLQVRIARQQKECIVIVDPVAELVDGRNEGVAGVKERECIPILERKGGLKDGETPRPWAGSGKQ